MLAQQGFFPSKAGSIVGVIVVDIMNMIIDLRGQESLTFLLLEFPQIIAQLS
jgi:hypothetical protein